MVILTCRHRFKFDIVLSGRLDYDFTLLRRDATTNGPLLLKIFELVHALNVIDTIINPLRRFLHLPPLGLYLPRFIFLRRQLFLASPIPLSLMMSLHLLTLRRPFQLLETLANSVLLLLVVVVIIIIIIMFHRRVSIRSELCYTLCCYLLLLSGVLLVVGRRRP